MSEPLGLAEATAHLTAEGQIFEMTTAVIRGQELRVWKHAPTTLGAVLELSRGHGDKDFLVYEDERVSFTEHYAQVATVARRLLDVGLGRGDRVAIAMRNLPEWVVAFWSGIAAGGVAVPLNAWWTGDELTYGIADSGAAVLFCDLERLARLAPHLAGATALRLIVVVDERRGPRGSRCSPASLDTSTSVTASRATCSSRPKPRSASSTSSWTAPRTTAPSPRSTSIPTTTPRSSTRRGRRVARRARWARTATPARTS